VPPEQETENTDYGNLEYIRTELKGNVNVSRTSPLKNFFILLGGISGIILSCYVLLGFAVDIIVPRLPVTFEKSMGGFFLKKFRVTKTDQPNPRLQNILDHLSAEMENSGLSYKVYTVPNKKFNALALPGGNILLFAGLLDKVDSDTEIAFVLAHELGHYAARDHLRGLGRGLIFLFMSVSIAGNDSALTGFIGNSLTKVEMKFSQEQEKAADLRALELLNKTYGEVNGAVELMKKISALEKKGKLFYYFATHPHPEKRLEFIRQEAERKGYKLRK